MMPNMPDIEAILHTLTARLPELAWRLNDVPRIASTKLPRGLFQDVSLHGWLSSQQCVDSLRHDLRALSTCDDLLAAHFIAQRFERKMNVLLRICRESQQKAKASFRPLFAVQQLSTRQQWHTQLQRDIEHLEAQEAALNTALHAYFEQNVASDATLKLQHELGEVSRRLTLAREALARF